MTTERRKTIRLTVDVSERDNQLLESLAAQAQKSKSQVFREGLELIREYVTRTNAGEEALYRDSEGRETRTQLLGYQGIKIDP